jgi:hypothetical protein
MYDAASGDEPNLYPLSVFLTWQCLQQSPQMFVLKLEKKIDAMQMGSWALPTLGFSMISHFLRTSQVQ